jgi:uncharacterized membrane protein YdfJ with MMPL/SSD domain
LLWFLLLLLLLLLLLILLLRGEKPLFRYAPQGFLPPQKQDQPQQQQQKPKQRQNRGSAVQLLVKSQEQLKTQAILS